MKRIYFIIIQWLRGRRNCDVSLTDHPRHYLAASAHSLTHSLARHRSSPLDSCSRLLPARALSACLRRPRRRRRRSAHRCIQQTQPPRPPPLCHGPLCLSWDGAIMRQCRRPSTASSFIFYLSLSLSLDCFPPITVLPVMKQPSIELMSRSFSLRSVTQPENCWCCYVMSIHSCSAHSNYFWQLRRRLVYYSGT